MVYCDVPSGWGTEERRRGTQGGHMCSPTMGMLYASAQVEQANSH